MKNWWNEFYDDLLADFLLNDHSEEELNRSCDFILKTLELSSGALVMDQCCGTGRLLFPLARRGYRCVGFDQSQQYIDQAQQQREAQLPHSSDLQLLCADAFDYVHPEPCDGIFNWWTSFGYTRDDALNLKMLQNAARSLKRHGFYLLDTLNPAGVLRHFKEYMVNEIVKDGALITLIRHTRINWQTGEMEKDWTYLLPDGSRKTHHTRVKLYFPHQLIEMMRSCGFDQFELYGDEEGSALGLDSLRCIVRARRGD